MENHLNRAAQGWPVAPLTLVDAQRLVGTFMYQWAQLETSLDVAIRRILRFDSVAMAILSVNLPFSAKLYTARCAVGLFGDHDAKRQKAVQKVLIDIGKMSEDRNMLAHTAFNINRDKEGVEFYRIKATSKLSVPDEIWKPNDFSIKIMTMVSLMGELKTVMDETIEFRSAVDLRKRETQGVIAHLLAAGQEALAKDKADAPVNSLFGLREPPASKQKPEQK